MNRRASTPWLLVLALPACGGAARDDASDSWGLGEAALLHPKAMVGALYTESAVVSLDIGFADGPWQAFVTAWKPVLDSDTWFHCSIEFNGTRYTDAACRHLSPAESSLWPGSSVNEKKPQFVVRFDEWDDSGRFFSLRRMILEASPVFAAPVRDRIGMWVARESGVTAPRVNHAWVTLNGQPLGLYENVEVVDHEFLEERYDEPLGEIYHEHNGTWHLDTDKSTGTTGPAEELAELVASWEMHPGDASYEDRFAAAAEVSEFLRERAAEAVLPTCDNFSNGAWSYYLHQGSSDPRFAVFPWYFEDAMSDRAPATADPWVFAGSMANADASTVPGLGFDLWTALDARPDWKREYDDDLVAIRDGAYAAAPERVARVCAQIRPYVAQDPNAYGTLDDFDADCQGLSGRITDRIAFLHKVLGR